MGGVLTSPRLIFFVPEHRQISAGSASAVLNVNNKKNMIVLKCPRLEHYSEDVIYIHIAITEIVDTAYNVCADNAKEAEKIAPQGLLLPKEHQNSDWLQVTRVTLVEYSIIHWWHSLKMNNPSESIQSFTNAVATSTGASDRKREATSSEPNEIPERTKSRDTEYATNAGSRYTLGEKRLSHAIAKASIISIINQHFSERPSQYVTLSETFISGISSYIRPGWLPWIITRPEQVHCIINQELKGM